MYFRTEALSLIRTDVKERASRYVLLTRELGKIEARIEGARSPKSKLSPQAEPVSLVDAYLVKGRSGYKLIQVSSLKRFGFQTPKQWSFVFHFIESLVKLLPEEVPEQLIFEHAQSVLEYVEREQAIHRGVWGYVYLLLLEYLGYFPGNLILENAQRTTAERMLSVGFEHGIVEMARLDSSSSARRESNESLTALVLQNVKALLQTEHKSSGFLREVMSGRKE